MKCKMKIFIMPQTIKKSGEISTKASKNLCNIIET